MTAWPASAHSVCTDMMPSLCVSCYGERRGGERMEEEEGSVEMWVVRGKGERKVGGGGGRSGGLWRYGWSGGRVRGRWEGEEGGGGG